jgi:hypothetical protein
MIKKKKWIWSSCVDIQVIHSLDYVLSQGDSRFWEFDYKRRMQDTALFQGHVGLLSWAIVYQDLDHAIKWIPLYVPQDIVIEHEKILGWPRRRVKIGFKVINAQSINNVPRGVKWSRGIVSFVNYALWTNPWSMCLALLCGFRYISMGLHTNKDFILPMS